MLGLSSRLLGNFYALWWPKNDLYNRQYFFSPICALLAKLFAYRLYAISMQSLLLYLSKISKISPTLSFSASKLESLDLLSNATHWQLSK